MTVQNSTGLMFATLLACAGCVYAPVGEARSARTAMESCMNACARMPALVFGQQRVVMCGGEQSTQSSSSSSKSSGDFERVIADRGPRVTSNDPSSYQRKCMDCDVQRVTQDHGPVATFTSPETSKPKK